MKQIWKFPIALTIELPVGAEILTVQEQFGVGYIWALVDPEAKTEKRQFVLVGTGHAFNISTWRYIGTYQQAVGFLVWHLFEVL